ncbi:MAG: hypothetical protein JWQ57_3723 [Mucilaginibacter sp.]|nr:hypothetical protein [Mucilaginibacter sp.]
MTRILKFNKFVNVLLGALAEDPEAHHLLNIYQGI